MNKFQRLFSFLFIAVLVASCGNKDDDSSTPLRDYQTQYNTDKANIEEFLKTHSYTVVDAPGTPQDQDIIFDSIPEGPNSIWFDEKLIPRTVTANGVEYTMYYLDIRRGGGALDNQPYPCNVDNVLTSYVGTYLYRVTETDDNETPTNTTDDTTITYVKNIEFQTIPFPQALLGLEGSVRGFSEIMPQFRAGDIVDVPGQPSSYNDFGAGVMFIPSGLGYYANAQPNIPSYSPLIFRFKLYGVDRADQDGDGIDSYDEDIDHNRYIYFYEDNITDDTDGDEIPDYRDVDDDDDEVLTKVELLKVEGGEDMYDFSGAPSCSGDVVDPARLRLYRDPACTKYVTP